MGDCHSFELFKIRKLYDFTWKSFNIIFNFVDITHVMRFISFNNNSTLD